MDFQLITAAALIALGSLLALLIGRSLGHRLGRYRIPVFAGAVILTSLYASTGAGRIENIAVFTHSSAVLLSNLTPILVGFLAGFAWAIPGVPSRRAAVVLSSLVVLGGVFLFAPLLRPLLMPIELEPLSRWRGGICLQTHDASCGPAAAATLLRLHGIETDERTMADACLTSRAGTEPLALYRGLNLQTRGTGLQPRLASRRPADWVRQGQYPVLAMVTPPAAQMIPPNRSGRLRKLLGRSRSEGHAVVVLGQLDNGAFLIGDPASGKRVWDANLMSHFFSGQAIYLQQQ